MRISEEEFYEIVDEALDSLPEKFQARIHNVAIMVRDFPEPGQLKSLGIRNRYGLLGLYEGHHQSSRRNVGPVLPDRIYLFQESIQRSCSTPEQCRRQIRSVLKHEIAHHFGSDEPGARKAGVRP